MQIAIDIFAVTAIVSLFMAGKNLYVSVCNLNDRVKKLEKEARR